MIHVKGRIDVKRNVIILLVFLLAASWYMTLTGITDKASAYAKSSENAKKHEDKGMFIAAIEDYATVLGFSSDNYDALVATANDYYELGEYQQFEDTGKEIIEKYDADEGIFNKLMDYYVDKKKYSDALAYLHVLMEKFPENEMIIDRYNSLKGSYSTKFNTYQWVGDFYHGYAACQAGTLKYASTNYNDELKVNLNYDWAGPYEAEIKGTPVLLDDAGVCYVNKKGQRILVPDFRAKYLGVLAGGYILAGDENGKYGYIKSDCSNATEMEFDNATALVNNFGAVKKGEKWAIIGSDFKPTTEFIFDDVVMDDNHVATRGSVMWVKNGSGYQLVNRDGEAVSDEIYEAARPFASKEAAAALKNGKWGFVGRDGVELTDFVYEDAKSFCAGFAPVKDKDGYWKYIDINGNICIDDNFTDAKAFDEKGVAFVQKEESYWIMIDLYDVD